MPPPHPPKTLPLFSSVSLPSCQERFYNSTVSICLFLHFSHLTLPYFRHFFFSFSRSVAPSLACLLTLSFFFRLSTVHIFRSRNFTSSPRLDSNSSQRGVPRSHLFRLLFLYDPIETSSPFMRTIITISGAANCNWNGVRPVLKLRSSQSGAPTGIGRHAAGNETKRFIETAWTKRFFKLFVFLSFLAKSRAIILFYSIVRARAYACVFSTFPLVYLSRYYIASSNAFSLDSGHLPFELCHAILWLLITIRGARFVSMKKCAIFFLSKKKVVSILAPCHFYPAYVKSLFYAHPYLRIIS